MTNQLSDREEANSDWKTFCRLGGASAFIAASFAMLQIIIEIIGVGIMRIEVPTTVIGWFTLLKSHTLLGLTELTVFQIPAIALCLPMFLALYNVLRQKSSAYELVATTLALLGMAIYLASNTAFSMFSLSNQYVHATTEAQRSILLAAGQAMLATYEGSGVDVGLFLFLIAILMISVMMLRSNVFDRLTAFAGILAGSISLVYYISSVFSPMAIFIFELAGLFFVVWIILVGRRLLQLAGGVHQTHH